MKPQLGAIPVILDTDIGTDIDDTWALAMLLRSPELDIRLIVSDTDDTEYRAAIIARLLEEWPTNAYRALLRIRSEPDACVE